MQPIEKIEDIPPYPSVGSLKRHLSMNGCKLCSLGFQPEINGVCVARGSELTNKMIIGEAPGKEEDSRREPFTGPAGRLLDDIWKSVGMDTKDWYITNTVLCRPFSPKGSGKENFTPKEEQRKKCSVYLQRQIELLKPKLIVTIGGVATEAVCGVKGLKIGDYRGKLLRSMPGAQGALIFPMIHPAAILHSKGTEKYDLYRQQTWQDVQELKRILGEHNI